MKWTQKQDSALLAARYRKKPVPWWMMAGKLQFGRRNADAIKRHFYRLTVAACVLLACTLMPVRAADIEPQPFWGLLDGVSTSVLTDMRADMLEARVEKKLDDYWSVGLLGTYFADNSDDPAKDWGIGGFVKLMVDPEARFPLSGWLPWLGEKLQLPESLDADAYIVGKGEVLPYDDDIDLLLGVGPGFAMGPFIVEYVYNVVESGDADSPALSSKPVLWFGMTPIKF